jgi:PleD family two-component response regulator
MRLADEAQTDPLTGLPNRRAWDAQVKRLHSEGGLLRECDSETALEVTERLRGSVSDNWTCSAGIAAGRPGESAEDTIARADVALYEAKAAGRDRTHLAGVA